MSISNKIYLIGCGNLGLHLGLALKEKGFNFSGVYSRKKEKAEKAANLLNCPAIYNLYNIPPDTKIIILSVPDKALIEISEKLNSPEQIIFHTSGSVEMDIIKNISSKYGVFYPLQTFSKNRNIKFNDIPLFIEASDKITLNLLSEISNKLSTNVNYLNSEKRKILHLAAVFACNFSNFMIYNAEKILEDYNLPKEFLYPLIKETYLKAIEKGAINSQTGPAVRGDKIIINKHLKILSNSHNKRNIYELLSNYITDEFK